MRKLLFALKDGSRTPSELRAAIGVQHRQTFRKNYLNPAIRADLICAEDGLSPHDPRIRYALTHPAECAAVAAAAKTVVRDRYAIGRVADEISALYFVNND